MTTNHNPGEKALPGIVCDVTNCHYHHQGRKCTAREIQVGPQHASTSADTVCDTFRPGSSATM